MKKFLLLLYCCSLAIASYGYGFESDSLYHRFYFRTGSCTPELSFRKNSSHLDSLLQSLRSMESKASLHHIFVISSASPIGNTAFNRTLSAKRGVALRSVLQERLQLPDSLFVLSSIGQNWEGLSFLVKNSNMPYREEVLHILYDTPEWIVRNGVVVDGRKRQLMMLHGGRTWRYMQERFFPELCHSSVQYDFVYAPLPDESKLLKRTPIVAAIPPTLGNRSFRTPT